MAKHLRTKNDIVYTSPQFAQKIVSYFNPQGTCLEPCKGDGAFYNVLPQPKLYCELQEGKDFLEFNQEVDWIITNPPWSSKAYRAVANHAFKLADNVVFLIRFHNAFGTFARHRDYLEHNHSLKEIILCKWQEAFDESKVPEGFALAIVHWQKNYSGNCKWSYWI